MDNRKETHTYIKTNLMFWHWASIQLRPFIDRVTISGMRVSKPDWLKFMVVWEVLFQQRKKIVFDKIGDLMVYCSIHQPIFLKKQGSWNGSGHSTKEINAHNTVHLTQKSPYWDALDVCLFQSWPSVFNNSRYFPRCWYIKQRVPHLWRKGKPQDNRTVRARRALRDF